MGRRGRRRRSVDREHNPEWCAIVRGTRREPEAERWLRQAAEARGLTLREHEAAQRAKLRDLTRPETAHLAIRAPAHRIAAILKTGSGSHRIGDPSALRGKGPDAAATAARYVRARREFEAAGWGSGPVVYGYVGSPRESLPLATTAIYGDAKLILTDAIRSRATIVAADSYLYSKHAAASPIDRPSHLSIPWWLDVLDCTAPIALNGDADRAPDPALYDRLHPEHRSLLERIRSRPDRGLFIEAQIVGGISPSDIAAVHLTYPPDDGTRNALDAARVPWAIWPDVPCPARPRGCPEAITGSPSATRALRNRPRVAPVIDARARAWGLTRAEHNAATRARLRHLTHRSRTHIAIRVPHAALPAILSTEAITPAASHEQAAGGIPSINPRADFADRRQREQLAVGPEPITYGYVSTRLEALPHTPTSIYGDAKLILRQVVRPRTTVSYAWTVTGPVAPTPIDTPDEASVPAWATLYAAEKPVREQHDAPVKIGPGISAARTEDLNAHPARDRPGTGPEGADPTHRLELLDRGLTWQHADHNLICHIRGPVTLADIEAVHLQQPPTQRLSAALDHAGIPWAIYPNLPQRRPSGALQRALTHPNARDRGSPCPRMGTRTR